MKISEILEEAKELRRDLNYREYTYYRKDCTTLKKLHFKNSREYYEELTKDKDLEKVSLKILRRKNGKDIYIIEESKQNGEILSKATFKCSEAFNILVKELEVTNIERFRFFIEEFFEYFTLGDALESILNKIKLYNNIFNRYNKDEDFKDLIDSIKH